MIRTKENVELTNKERNEVLSHRLQLYKKRSILEKLDYILIGIMFKFKRLFGK